MSQNVALDALAARIGADNLRTDREARRRATGSWSPQATKGRLTDGNGDALLVAAVARAADADAVAVIVAWANETHSALLPLGGVSNTVGSTMPPADSRCRVAVDLSGLKAVDWSEESLTVTVGVGWTVGELEKTLNAHDYTLGQYPQSFDLLTVGGAISADAVGALAGKYGRFGDITLGVDAVLPTGLAVTTRMPPMGSAGPSLQPLFVGGEGRFGIVTAATLRLRTAPEARAWAAFTFPAFDDGIDAVRLVHRSDARPSGVRLLDHAAASSVGASLAEAAGLAPRGTLLLLAFEGDEIVQTGHFQLAYGVCQQVGGTPAPDPDLGERWFADWRSAPGAAWAANGRPGGLADVFRLSAPYAALKTVRADVQKALRPLVTTQAAQIGGADGSGASLEIAFEAQAPTDAEALALYSRITDAALTACLNAGGAVAFSGGIGQSRAAHVARERGPEASDALRALQAALDPNRVFADNGGF